MEDSGLDGRIITRWIFREVGCGCMDWIELALDKDRWREFVNGIMNLGVSTKCGGNFLTSLETVSFSIRTVLCGVSK